MKNSLKYAIAQGIFEAFPISSSWHLTLLNYHTIDAAVLHLGGSIAFAFFWRKLIFRILKKILNRNSMYQKITCNLIILTLPTIFIGFCIKEHAFNLENAPYFNLFFAGLLVISNKMPTKKSIISLNFRQLLTIGTIIALALIPGTSRMGLTFTMLRFFQLRKLDSFAITCLIGIPITAGASILSMHTFANINQAILSGIITYILLFITKKSLNYWPIYGIYRIILSIIMLLKRI